MLLPISLLLGGFYMLDKHNERTAPKALPEKPNMRPQPKFTPAAIELLTIDVDGARVFRPNAMGDAVKALESSSLELVRFDRGPSEILIYRLVPLQWGVENASVAIKKARERGLFVLASLSLALSDPREQELLLLFGGKTALRYANANSVFAVLAMPDPPKVAVEPIVAEAAPIVETTPPVKAKRNGKVEKTPFPEPAVEPMLVEEVES